MSLGLWSRLIWLGICQAGWCLIKYSDRLQFFHWILVCRRGRWCQRLSHKFLLMGLPRIWCPCSVRAHSIELVCVCGCCSSLRLVRECALHVSFASILRGGCTCARCSTSAQAQVRRRSKHSLMCSAVLPCKGFFVRIGACWICCSFDTALKVEIVLNLTARYVRALIRREGCVETVWWWDLREVWIFIAFGGASQLLSHRLLDKSFLYTARS